MSRTLPLNSGIIPVSHRYRICESSSQSQTNQTWGWKKNQLTKKESVNSIMLLTRNYILRRRTNKYQILHKYIDTHIYTHIQTITRAACLSSCCKFSSSKYDIACSLEQEKDKSK